MGETDCQEPSQRAHLSLKNLIGLKTKMESDNSLRSRGLPREIG